jgi:hypothetical protein
MVSKLKEVRQVEAKSSWRDVPLVSEISQMNNYLIREFPLILKKPFKKKIVENKKL